jgi:hypothetical protein
MKIGDLVRYIPTASARDVTFTAAKVLVGIIVDITVHTETYASAGCSKYIVFTEYGTILKVWSGNLEVINDSL